MERHSAATAGGYMTYQDKDIGQLIKRIAQLEAALRKAHGVIRSCVTSGVLRHDLNCFLAEESSVLENEVSK